MKNKLLLLLALFALSIATFGQYTEDKLPSGLTLTTSIGDADYMILQKNGETIVKAARMDTIQAYMTSVMAADVESLDSVSGSTGQFIISDGVGWLTPASAKYEGSGAYSFGYRTGTVGWGSMVIGGSVYFSNTASGAYSSSFGQRSISSNNGSMSWGLITTASGDRATAWGVQSIASGISSTAFGSLTTASGLNSFAGGNGSVASGIGAFSFGYQDTASGDYSIAGGSGSTASGNSSFALGNNTETIGNSSFASGINTTASGDYSTAMGASSTASGESSTASGYYSTASGISSFASGNNSTASGISSFASGNHTSANSYAETVIGAYPDTVTPTSATTYQATDWLFGIGNGTGVGAKSNALVMLKNGNTTATGDWTIDGDLSVTGAITSTDVPFAFGYFGDSAVIFTFAATDTWYHLTNDTDSAWIYSELDNVTVSNDTLTFANAGHYNFDFHLSFIGGNQDVYAVRFYNVTQGVGIPTTVGQTGQGALDVVSLNITSHGIITAGDEVVLQIKCDDTDAATFKNSTIRIQYIHE